MAINSLPQSVLAAEGNNSSTATPLPSNSTSPTAPVLRKNPCSQITTNEAARNSCNSFFSDEKASGSLSSFATAVVVSTASDLAKAVKNAHDQGTIILLEPKSYYLLERLEINKRTALVGIESGNKKPAIKITAPLVKKHSLLPSLAHLPKAPDSMGFYSTSIDWDTTLSVADPYSNAYAIYGSHYPGEVRLYKNTFSQSNSNTRLIDFVALVKPASPVYAGYNTFHTTNVHHSSIYSDCRQCGDEDPQVIIESNKLASDKGTRSNTNKAFHLVGHSKFIIRGNDQLTRQATSTIKLNLPNKAGLRGFVEDNQANMDTPEKYRSLDVEVQGKGDKVAGLLTVSGNDYFNWNNDGLKPENLDRIPGKIPPTKSAHSTPATGTTPTTVETPTTAFVRTNPCSQIVTDGAAKTSCNNFFNNPSAAGTKSSFAKATVVKNTDELVDAVTKASAKGSIIVLKQGIYEPSAQLVIDQATALVGVKSGDTLPTVRMTSKVLKSSTKDDSSKDDSSGDEKSKEHSLVLLPKKGTSSGGFYSAFINWETSKDDEDDEDGYIIFGSTYSGEVRLYGNAFVNKGDNAILDDYVTLKTPGGNVVIDSNRFNTSNLWSHAFVSDCTDCNKFEPEVTILNNTLTSTDGAENDENEYAFKLINHKKFTIKGNRAVTSEATASIEVELPNRPGLQASIENNQANIGAFSEHRVIKITEPFTEYDYELAITGRLTVSGNDYYEVSHGDDDGSYIEITEGKPVPTSAPVSGSATSTTPASATNPCDSLNDDLAARKACNDFLNSADASGGDKDFSHALVVRDASELHKAVAHDHREGKPFSGSIIILKAGTYSLSGQLRINHKVALVGEKSGESLPKLTAGKRFTRRHYDLNALAYLRKDSSNATSGFFSTHILWETTLISNDKDAYYYYQAAIGSNAYNGKIRIFENTFTHKGTKSRVSDFLRLEDASGDTYIGHNTFDTTLIGYAVVDARCKKCSGFDPKLEIVSNRLTSKEGSTRQYYATAFKITGYTRFNIEDNEQKDAKVTDIRISLKNDTDGLEGVVRNNTAPATEPPLTPPKIKLFFFPGFGSPLNISGSLVTTPNSHYSIEDPDGLVAHIRTDHGTSFTATPPAGSNPCNSVVGDDTAKESCNQFFENTRAAGPNPSFSQAEVVHSARDLVNAIENANPQGAIILLHANVYELNKPLDINSKIALVGIKNGSSLPTVKPTAELFDHADLLNSIVHLNSEESANPKGFYSAFINWDTSIKPGETLTKPRMYVYGIYGDQYPGLVSLHGNTFTHSNKHDKVPLDGFVYLDDVAGPTYIDSNTFDTSRAYYSAIDASCSTCNQSGLEIQITSNKLTSDSKAKAARYSFDLTGFSRFIVEGNTALTPEVNASMLITLPNEAGLKASVKNNIAHQGASETFRTIEIDDDLPYGEVSRIRGNLVISGNDYFVVDHDDDYNAYIVLTEGKDVPTPSPTARVPSSTLVTSSIKPTPSTPAPNSSVTPAMVSNPCDNLKGKATARALCNSFLNNADATGNDKSFSHAIEVTTAEELINAVEDKHLGEEGGDEAFSGSIIILRRGTYGLTRQLDISHKVALVGEKSGNSLPTIKAIDDITVPPPTIDSLAFLRDGYPHPSGFYSTDIQWDTSLSLRGGNVIRKTAIDCAYYSGKVRIYGNHFKHSHDYTAVNYYLHLNTAHGDAYIANSTFDTTGLHNTAIYVRCTDCAIYNPKLEILSNRFTARKNAVLAENAVAMQIYYYTRFRVDNNRQEDANAAAHINVRVENHITGLQGFIRNNIAHQKAPAQQRVISVRQTIYGSDKASADGEVKISGNDYYSLKAPGSIGDFIAYIEGKVAEPASFTPNPPLSTVCDTLKSTASIIWTCEDFLDNSDASGGGSFSSVVVVSNASELVDAVNKKQPDGKGRIVILKHGTYDIPEQLDITDQIALVGEVDESAYPVIRTTEAASVSNFSNRSLAYLHHTDGSSTTTGFFSHHIHWETAHPSNKSSPIYTGAIYSKSFKGKIRLYQNKFSQSKETSAISFIYLNSAIGGAYIKDNWINTANLRHNAIFAYCQDDGCQTDNPPLEISSNRFYSHSKPVPSGQHLAIYIRGYAQFKILSNVQETKYAHGKISAEDHKNIQKINAYIQDNRADPEAPQSQRQIWITSFFTPEGSKKITGKIHISGNEHYSYRDSGYTLAHVDYIPDPSVTTTPAIQKHPCDDIKDHAKAFAACHAFLKNDKASGPASRKPSFSHAFIVDSARSLMDAVEKERYDGKPFIGSIIILRPGTYELPRPLKISHRVALVGEKDTNGKLPILKTSEGFSVPSGGKYALAYLHGTARVQEAGFYSRNLMWQTSFIAEGSAQLFEALIESFGYKGEIRLYNNIFGYGDTDARSLYILHLQANPNQHIYIANNTFDSSRASVSVIESTGPDGRNNRATIDIVSNTFTSSASSKHPTYEVPNAIFLDRYQNLNISENVQATSLAAGTIKVFFQNHRDIKKAFIRNNKANKDADIDNRKIELELIAGLSDLITVTGSVDVTGNDFYRFETAGMSVGHYRYVAGEKEADATTPEPPLTDTQPLVESTRSPTTAATTEPSVATTEPQYSSCNLLSNADETQYCNAFAKRLKKLKREESFPEIVAVKNRDELVSEVAGSTGSGKMIMLHGGHYELDEPLRIRSKMALVGMGNAIIKSAHSFYATEQAELVLLDHDHTSDGFYAMGVTWDISLGSNPERKPFSSAVKAINYPGDIVLLDNDFQYDSTGNVEEAPSHYIDVQKSTGNVLIADNTFFTGGLQKSAVYANCKECLKDNQYIHVSGNRFSDTKEVESSVSAIDVRFYKNLDIDGNSQQTASASARINVVLPNYKDDINAVIKGNLALAASDEQRKTIELSIGSLAKEPVSISGSVNVSDNQCYTLREYGIPGNILNLVEGKCLNSGLASAQTQQGGGSSANDAFYKYGLPVVGSFVLYGLAVGGFRLAGACGSKGGMWFYKKLIFPVHLVQSALSSCLSKYHGYKGHDEGSEGVGLKEMPSHEGKPGDSTSAEGSETEHLTKKMEF